MVEVVDDAPTTAISPVLASHKNPTNEVLRGSSD